MSKSPPHNRLMRSAIVSVTVVALHGCASNENPCEQILEVKQQHQDCERLRKTMSKTDYPQQALTAKLRYEEACTNLRYYRDEFDTICKNDGTAIGETRKKEQ
ncbi:hypothetical protein [Aliiglaciecola litoralis]|uniref:Lipoprotein n=1 Tax=Aliiglaciecola litoralis TaxID=582857 RepID=A0ABN1LLS6_9ALTE